ncbi:hypothetical protein FOA52_015841 [Chlamydomonas sp. UWO 241]|nr:hypothetical protein FOA52_015841 [Chlamydomonas sp. UWO 241]
MTTTRRIIFVRHGESEANLQLASHISGQSNASPLTELGRAQSAALGKHLCSMLRLKQGDLSVDNLPVNARIFTSTAVRAVETAAGLQAGLGEHLLAAGLTVDPSAFIRCEALPDLLEISMGQIARYPGNFSAPGGESLRDVEHRMTRCVRETVLPHAVPGGPPVVVVSHGIAIKCFLRESLNSDVASLRKVDCHNTSVTEVAWVESGNLQGWNVLRVNDTAHLLLEGMY